jgi:hypothetical protein
LGGLGRKLKHWKSSAICHGLRRIIQNILKKDRLFPQLANSPHF